MLYVTQLIYLQPGGEAAFDAFEAAAIPLIAEHGGRLLLRLRPTPDTVIEAGAEIPYEVHLVSFPDAGAFRRFKADDRRQAFLHLKNQSVRSVLLIEGEAV